MKVPRLIAVWRLPAPKLLRAAAFMTLVGLAFMIWSMFDPTPLPVMLAMTIGQVIGTLAFGMYGIAVLLDVLRVRRARRESQRIPIISASPEEM